RCGPYVAQLAAVVMVGHGATRRCDVRPGGVDHRLGRGDAVRPSDDGRAATRPLEEAVDGRPPPVLNNVAGVEELRRNPRRVAAAASLESAGSAPPVDLLEQGPAQRNQVGVTRLDEPLAERALQRDAAPLADGRRLDAARREIHPGHGRPPRKFRLNYKLNIFAQRVPTRISDVWRILDLGCS